MGTCVEENDVRVPCQQFLGFWETYVENDVRLNLWFQVLNLLSKMWENHVEECEGLVFNSSPLRFMCPHIN